MIRKSYLSAIFALIYWQGSFGQPNFNNDCRSQWRGYWQCVTTENGYFTDRVYLTASGRDRLVNEVQRCFQDARCSQAYDYKIVSAQKDCFKRYQADTNRYLQQCVQLRYQKSFDLPDEDILPYFLDYQKNWIRRVIFEQNFCMSELRGPLAQCVENQFNELTRKSRREGDECQNKRRVCGPRIRLACYSDWNTKIKPLLRDCIGTWNADQRDNMQRRYSQCVADRTGGRYDAFKYDDSHFKWFDYGNLIQRYVDRREPCGGSIS